jgi:hypothetical protein
MQAQVAGRARWRGGGHGPHHGRAGGGLKIAGVFFKQRGQRVRADLGDVHGVAQTSVRCQHKGMNGAD